LLLGATVLGKREEFIASYAEFMGCSYPDVPATVEIQPVYVP